MDVSTSASVGDITTLAMSFRRSLRASNLSERTIKTYTEAVDLFGRFLAETGMPTAVADIRREHVESFVEHLLGLWNVEDQAHRDRRPTARRRVDPEGELGVLEDVVVVLPGRSRVVLFEGDSVLKTHMAVRYKPEAVRPAKPRRRRRTVGS